jgi:membrane-associated phospholipid phosphatase
MKSRNVRAMKCSALLLALVLVNPPTLAAQSRTHTIRWWHVVAVAGGIGAASVFDRGVDAWIQDRRSPTSDRWARVFRNGGQPDVVFGVPAAMLAAGWIGGRPGVRRAGERVLASVLVAGFTTVGIKEVTGRVRPFETHDQYLFRPFSGKDAFPSGHATMAFALATSLGAEIHNRAVSALLYAGATGTAWSRLNDQRHWLSDVLAGAAVGLTSAKLIEGQWRIFGLAPPRFLGSPHAAKLDWRVEF